MSLAKLKKVLALAPKEELMDIIVTLYGARKEAKEFLEFYLTPDVEEKAEKAWRKITKEFNRRKYGMISPRMSRVKEAIKDFASLQPGEEEVVKLTLRTVQEAVIQSTRTAMRNQAAVSCSKMAEKLVGDSDAIGLAPYVLQVYDDTLRSPRLGPLSSPIADSIRDIVCNSYMGSTS